MALPSLFRLAVKSSALTLATLGLLVPGAALAAPPDEVEGSGESETDVADPGDPPAADSDEPTDAAPEADALDPMDRARELFEHGAGQYETADYAGAIASWTDAYSLIPAVPENAGAKADLSFNIAAAHEKSFGVDGDIGHLHQARILLEKYKETVPSLHQDDATEELFRVTERVREIEDKIEAAEAAQQRGKDPVIVLDPKPGRGLVVLGSIVAGVGVAGLGVGAAGLGIGAGANDIGGLDPRDEQARADQFQRGRTGNTLGIVGLSAGSVLVGVGIALLAVGVAKNKKGVQELEIQRNFRASGFGRTWAIGPAASEDGAGAVLVGRF